MRRVLAALAVVWLAGCAAPLPPPVDDPQRAWRAHARDLASVTRWELSGKVGLRSPEHNGQANVVWQRDGDTHRINLFGPFGVGQVVLDQDAAGARLRDGKRNEYQAATARDVLYQATGWVVPFEQLTYWLAGLPAPGAADALDLDSWGRLKRLRQAGWEVDFLEYGREGRLDLPRRVNATRASAGAPVELRLVVNECEFSL